MNDINEIIYNQGGLYFFDILDLSLIQLFVFLGIIFLSFYSLKYISNFLKVKLNDCKIIYSYHMIFFFIFFYFSMFNVNDHDSYFQLAKFYPAITISEVYSEELRLSVETMSIIYYFLIYYFNLGFLNISLFGSLLSLFSIIILYKFISSKLVITKFKSYSIFIVLYPGLHFWTSSLNKESLCVSLMIISFYLMQLNKNFFAFLFISPILLIRPHIGLLLVLSLFCYYTYLYVVNNLIKKKKKLEIIILIFLFVISLSYLILFSKYSNQIMNFQASGLHIRATLKNFSGYIDNQNIDNWILMVKFLIFPLFDVGSFQKILFSIENILLLLLLIYLTFIEKFYYYSKNNTNLYYLLIIFLLLFLLSNFISNAGIISRQKIMIIIPMIFLITNCLNAKYKK